MMIAPEPAAQKAWMDAQKDALKPGVSTRRCKHSLIISKLRKWTTTKLQCADAIAI